MHAFVYMHIIYIYIYINISYVHANISSNFRQKWCSEWAPQELLHICTHWFLYEKSNTWDLCISHASSFIPCCASCLDHHIQPSQPTTMHDGHPFQTLTLSTASGKFFKQLLAVCKRAQLILCFKDQWFEVRFAPCHMYANNISSVHICPEMSWHPQEKGKTTNLYNKGLIDMNDQLLNSKILTNSGFVHLDVFSRLVLSWMVISVSSGPLVTRLTSGSCVTLTHMTVVSCASVALPCRSSVIHSIRTVILSCPEYRFIYLSKTSTSQRFFWGGTSNCKMFLPSRSRLSDFVIQDHGAFAPWLLRGQWWAIQRLWSWGRGIWMINDALR